MRLDGEVLVCVEMKSLLSGTIGQAKVLDLLSLLQSIAVLLLMFVWR